MSFLPSCFFRSSAIYYHFAINSKQYLDSNSLLADPDGDSEMLSSSGSASPTGARTPTFNPISELSPPGSQTASHHGGLGEPSTIGSPTASFDQQGRAKTSNPQQQQQQQQQQPKEPSGASWNNQRAQEEYTRALESVVDRDFSLRKFQEIYTKAVWCDY
jgi:hypothetical protein